jgi:hypothetical protein
MAKRPQQERSQGKNEGLREPHPTYWNHGTDYTLSDVRFEPAGQQQWHSNEHASEEKQSARPVSMAGPSICGRGRDRREKFVDTIPIATISARRNRFAPPRNYTALELRVTSPVPSMLVKLD